MSSDLAERRAAVLGPNVPTFYDSPVHLVKGEGVWAWDADGCKYLDCYNNVPHVGHCHPHVVAAIATQAAKLNTYPLFALWNCGLLRATHRQISNAGGSGHHGLQRVRSQ